MEILTGKAIDIQKILNQWKHTYYTCIHDVTTVGNEIVVILTREKKKEEI